jgi:hypothetical protein
LTQPNCADPVGSASVSVVNGTAPYSYSWSPAAVAAPTGTANTNLPPSSSYTVSVTDDAGCTAYSTFSINPFSGAPSYTLTNNPGLALSCATPSTTLTLAPTNANTSYVLEWTIRRLIQPMSQQQWQQQQLQVHILIWQSIQLVLVQFLEHLL